MGFIRNRQLRDATAISRVQFANDPTEGEPAASVALLGELDSVVHLPASYLDEILLRDTKSSASRFVEEVIDTFNATLLSRSWESHYLERVAIIPAEVPAPYCTVETALQPTYATFTKFSPKLAGPKVLHATFYVLWDAMIDFSAQATLDEFADDEISEDEKAVMVDHALNTLSANLVQNLSHQLVYYRSHGLPRVLGRAPLHALSAGASDRMADELGALVGLTGEQFRELPEAERDKVIAMNVQRSVESLRRMNAGGDEESSAKKT